MSWNSIQEALIEAALTQLTAMGLGVTGADGRHTHIEWPNLAFTPPRNPVGGFTQPVWAKVSFIPGATEPVTLGEQGKDEMVGILQIDLNQPVDTGDADVRAALTPLENYFTPGRTLSKDGEDATVTASGRTPGRTIESTYYRVSLSVSWYARTQRPTIT